MDDSGAGRRRTEDGGRKTEGGRRRAEDGGRKTEDEGWRVEDWIAARLSCGVKV